MRRVMSPAHFFLSAKETIPCHRKAALDRSPDVKNGRLFLAWGYRRKKGSNSAAASFFAIVFIFFYRMSIISESLFTS